MIKNLTNYIDFIVPIVLGTETSLNIKYYTFPYGKIVLQNLAIYETEQAVTDGTMKNFITSLDLPVLWEKGTAQGTLGSYIGSSDIDIKSHNFTISYLYRPNTRTLSISITVNNLAQEV